jgi:hypothetical protein
MSLKKPKFVDGVMRFTLSYTGTQQEVRELIAGDQTIPDQFKRAIDSLLLPFTPEMKLSCNGRGVISELREGSFSIVISKLE